MIVYNSRTWGTFWQINGSILPRGCVFALPSALFGMALQIAVQNDWISLASISISGDASVYSGFTFVLGFTLVFRTQQSYSRYWTAATSIHEMRSEWYDSCASLIVFAKHSKKTATEIIRFQHLTVRLFSLLNAMALSEIASMDSQNFPLIDISGLNKECLSFLCSPLAHGRKTEIVFQWIKGVITSHMKDGLLDVPPPILTRVFQELGTGLTKYHDAVQIVIWPFPFPYAQLCVGLINLHMVLTPVLFSKVTTNPLAAFMLTFVAILSIKGLDVIASELENPFGTDPNDLPCKAMHRDMNHDLIMLLDDRTWAPPELSADAVLSVGQLYQMSQDDMNCSQFNDVESAGWGRGSEKSQKKAHHHEGINHDGDADEEVMMMLHVQDYIKIELHNKLPDVPLTPSCTTATRELSADAKPEATPAKSQIEQVIARPAPDWQAFLQSQKEQTLATQDMFFEKLEKFLAPLSLASIPARWVASSDRCYHVPPQPTVDAQLERLTNPAKGKQDIYQNGSTPIQANLLSTDSAVN